MNKQFFRKSPTHVIVTLGLLLAMEIILSRFFSIQTPFLKVSFSFVPLSMAAILYGPLPAAAMGALADFLGAVLFPVGAYFPGYTLTALLTGLVYGVFLYNRKITWWRVLSAVTVISLVLYLCLNTLWLYMTTEKAYLALLVPRIVKEAAMIPIQTVIIYLIGTRVITAQKKIAA